MQPDVMKLLATAAICQQVARGYQHSGSDVFRIVARVGYGYRVRRLLEAEELR